MRCERPLATASSFVLKSMTRKASSSLLTESGAGSALNDDQMFLKAYCIVTAFSQFDEIRFGSFNFLIAVLDLYVFGMLCVTLPQLSQYMF
jgi:hypothetical protein